MCVIVEMHKLTQWLLFQVEHYLILFSIGKKSYLDLGAELNGIESALTSKLAGKA